MNDKTTILFYLKGWCNLYPVYIHYSEDHGFMFIPRCLPRVAYWWNLFLDLFMKNEYFVVTGQLDTDKQIYIELEEKLDVVA